MDKINIGEHRIIPKDTIIWSIKAQTSMRTVKDEVVEIKHIGLEDDSLIFVVAKDVGFNVCGYEPYVTGRGTDEWTLDYSATLPYEIPQGRIGAPKRNDSL